MFGASCPSLVYTPPHAPPSVVPVARAHVGCTPQRCVQLVHPRGSWIRSAQTVSSSEHSATGSCDERGSTVESAQGGSEKRNPTTPWSLSIPLPPGPPSQLHHRLELRSTMRATSSSIWCISPSNTSPSSTCDTTRQYSSRSSATFAEVLRGAVLGSSRKGLRSSRIPAAHILPHLRREDSTAAPSSSLNDWADHCPHTSDTCNSGSK